MSDILCHRSPPEAWMLRDASRPLAGRNSLGGDVTLFLKIGWSSLTGEKGRHIARRCLAVPRNRPQLILKGDSFV